MTESQSNLGKVNFKNTQFASTALIKKKNKKLKKTQTPQNQPKPLLKCCNTLVINSDSSFVVSGFLRLKDLKAAVCFLVQLWNSMLLFWS